MRTGENAPELALYSSSCCEEEMIFDGNDRFCRCPRCEGLCEWDLIEPVISWSQLDEMAEQVA